MNPSPVGPSGHPPGLRRLGLLSVTLIIFFLLLMGLHLSERAQMATREADRQIGRHALLLSRLAEIAWKEGGVSPTTVLIAKQPGVRHVAFADLEGRALGSSDGRPSVGETAPSYWGSAGQIAALLNRKDHPLQLPYRAASGGNVQAVLAPVQTPGGWVIARFVLDAPDLNQDSPLRSFLIWYGIVAVGAVGYYAVRTGRRGWTAGVPEGNTGLMINAFHGLIAKLKENEEELQRLHHSAEERAEEVENYNENILQSVASGVITFDRELRVTTLNASAESILRVKSAEVVGKTGEAVFGAGARVLDLLRSAVDGGTVVSRQELEMEREGGDLIFLGISISLLKSRSGDVIGTTLVFSDLTEIKKLQEEVETKRRLTVLGEMSSWIAHEFRNDMGTILGLARLLSKDLGEDDPRQRLIQSIAGELSAMDRLITELLSYGKKTEIHPQPVSLRALVDEVVQLFETAGKWEGIRKEIHVSPHLPPVALDPVLMRQALSNLIQNALDAMAPGRQGRLSILSWPRPSEIVLEISDNGGGIAREHLDKIFLPFFTTKEKGTGLGLALVHKIVLSHHGRVDAKNVEGEGAVFRLTLPIYTPR